jgi:hypothetical protein
MDRYLFVANAQKHSILFVQAYKENKKLYCFPRPVGYVYRKEELKLCRYLTPRKTCGR